MRKKIYLLAILLIFVIKPYNGLAQIITTIAGGGADITTNGIPATSAALVQPEGISVDKTNNIYIADGGGNRIRKVDAMGMITTIAGTGVAGSSGDGGLATAAQINDPFGIYVDTIGNVYFSTGDYKIRKIDAAGLISTIAGGSGIPEDIDGAGNISGVRTVQGITGDTAGNIYFSDYDGGGAGGGTIRKIDKEGVVSTIAGNSNNAPGYAGDNGVAIEAQLGYPNSVSIDALGNIYVGDDVGDGTTTFNTVRKITTDGIINTVVGGNGIIGDSGDGGIATAATFNDIECAFADSTGNIFIADVGYDPTGNNKIRKVNTSGIISTIAGNGISGFSGDNGLAINAQLNEPWALITDKYGDIYIADLGNVRIRKVTVPSFTVRDGNWSDPTIWNKGKVPDAFTQVTINNSVTIDINAVAYSVSAQSTSLVNINRGLSLTITGH